MSPGTQGNPSFVLLCNFGGFALEEPLVETKQTCIQPGGRWVGSILHPRIKLCVQGRAERLPEVLCPLSLSRFCMPLSAHNESSLTCDLLSLCLLPCWPTGSTPGAVGAIPSGHLCLLFLTHCQSSANAGGRAVLQAQPMQSKVPWLVPGFGVVEITDRTRGVGGGDSLRAGRTPAHGLGTKVNHLKGRDRPRRAAGRKLL